MRFHLNKQSRLADWPSRIKITFDFGLKDGFVLFPKILAIGGFNEIPDS